LSWDAIKELILSAIMSTPNAARDSAKNFSYERVMGSDYSSF